LHEVSFISNQYVPAGTFISDGSRCFQVLDVSPVDPLPENSVLVKMERNNHSYQAIGYSFSQEHPFVAMPESEAQNIFDTEEGFRLATPREAQEYYA
jgi:hypothetical protein